MFSVDYPAIGASLVGCHYLFRLQVHLWACVDHCWWWTQGRRSVFQGSAFLESHPGTGQEKTLNHRACERSPTNTVYHTARALMTSLTFWCSASHRSGPDGVSHILMLSFPLGFLTWDSDRTLRPWFKCPLVKISKWSFDKCQSWPGAKVELLLSYVVNGHREEKDVEEVSGGVSDKHLRSWRLQTDLLVFSSTPKGFLYSEGCHSMSTLSSVAPLHSLLALKLTDCENHWMTLHFLVTHGETARGSYGCSLSCENVRLITWTELIL